MARVTAFGKLGGHRPLRRVVSISSVTGRGALSLDEARAWIGRQLILLRPLLDFAAGTPCAVMCVVDFGDGLLLWVRTDDQRLDDVDQFELADLEAHFHVLPPGDGERNTVTPLSAQPGVTRSETRAAPVASGEPASPGPALRLLRLSE